MSWALVYLLLGSGAVVALATMTWFLRRRRKAADQARQHAAARQWQRNMWAWSQIHPGEPVMEARVDREGSEVTWHGPPPPSPDA